ncbi:MAG TPA: hypothetical protein VF316_02845 [Polyangiaceae bacterium]
MTGSHLRCRCGEPTLSVRLSMELGPDDSSDDTAIQIVVCSACGFEGVGWYEASRRGSDERFHHFGYDTRVTPMVESTIGECPTPRVAKCGCFAHALMRKCVREPGWLGNGFAICA